MKCDTFLINNNVDPQRLSLVQVQFKHIKSNALVDTGADKSVISENLFNSLEKKDIVKVEKCNSEVCGVTEHKLKLLCSVLLKLKIGRTDIQHKFFIICNIVKPLIMGSDLFMGRKDLKIKIDCSNKTLSVGNSTVLLKNKKSVQSCNLVQVIDKTVVKPYSVTHIPKVNKKGQVPMVLVNHTDRTVVLKRGQTLGVAEDIKYSDVCSIEDKIAVENCCNEVNMNNKPLEGIKLDHLPKEERQKLEDLLSRYEPSLFAKSTKDLGHTDLVELSIDTGDAKPSK